MNETLTIILTAFSCMVIVAGVIISMRSSSLVYYRPSQAQQTIFTTEEELHFALLAPPVIPPSEPMPYVCAIPDHDYVIEREEHSDDPDWCVPPPQVDPWLVGYEYR